MSAVVIGLSIPLESSQVIYLQISVPAKRKPRSSRSLRWKAIYFSLSQLLSILELRDNFIFNNGLHRLAEKICKRSRSTHTKSVKGRGFWILLSGAKVSLLTSHLLPILVESEHRARSPERRSPICAWASLIGYKASWLNTVRDMPWFSFIPLVKSLVTSRTSPIYLNSIRNRLVELKKHTAGLEIILCRARARGLFIFGKFTFELEYILRSGNWWGEARRLHRTDKEPPL